MTAPRLVLMEIWRPLRYIGSRGPRCFWRECVPLEVRPSDGWHMNERGERVPHKNAGRVTWGAPSPWVVCAPEFARKALAMPNHFFTLDEHPGVTFCVRKMREPTLKDWAEVRRLRVQLPARPCPCGVSECIGDCGRGS